MIGTQQKRRSISICRHSPQGVDFSSFNTRGRVLAANRGHASISRLWEAVLTSIEMRIQEVEIA